MPNLVGSSETIENRLFFANILHALELARNGQGDSPAASCGPAMVRSRP
jgi:hypothetical protein